MTTLPLWINNRLPTGLVADKLVSSSCLSGQMMDLDRFLSIRKQYKIITLPDCPYTYMLVMYDVDDKEIIVIVLRKYMDIVYTSPLCDFAQIELKLVQPDYLQAILYPPPLVTVDRVIELCQISGKVML